MEKKFRFYRNNEMEILTLDELIDTARPDLVGAPVMQSFGVEADGKQIFAEDILELDATKIDEKLGFWDSNLGQEMAKHKLEQCVLHIRSNQFQEVAYSIFLKKDGRFITESEYYSIPKDDPDYAETDKPYCVKDTGIMFIRYLKNKGAVIIGNTYENNDLVPINE